MHSLHRERKKLEAVAVCNHPGGARVVLPVIESLIEKKPEIFFDLVLTHNAFPLFDLPARSVRKTLVNEDISTEDYEKLDFRQYAFVLAGTSISGNLEKSFVRKAREQGVPSFSVLDHWCEYRVRFQDTTGYLNAVPDAIFVPDEIAQRDLLDMGIPERQIVVSGHPAFDVAGKAAEYFSEKKRSQVLQQLALKDTRDYVLFVSEPVESDHGSQGLGYSEFSVLERICNTLVRLEMETRPALVIKLHPREDSSKYDPVLRAYSTLEIISVKDEIDRFDLMLSAKLVLGISSLLLLEASILGLPVYSIIPGDEGKSFIGVKLGWVKHLCNQTDIEDTLKMKKNDSPLLPIKHQPLSAHNISNFILSTINLKQN
jgi:hypothetical protein